MPFRTLHIEVEVN